MISNIKLTVALPMYNAKYIGWLALESLARQQDTTFNWELVVVEEDFDNPVGEKGVFEYETALRNIGCVNIKYVPVKDRLPLAKKWVYCAKYADDRSKVFLMQAADNFSNPIRLSKAFDKIYINDYDWTAYRRMPFYYIAEKKALYVRYKDIKEGGHLAGIGMSTKVKYVRKLPLANVWSGVDGWLFRNVRLYTLENKTKRHLMYGKKELTVLQKRKMMFVPEMNVSYIIDGSEIYGFNTRGMNNISKKKKYHKVKGMYKHISTDFWPEDIMYRLKEVKKYIKYA